MKLILRPQHFCVDSLLWYYESTRWKSLFRIWNYCFIITENTVIFLYWSWKNFPLRASLPMNNIIRNANYDEENIENHVLYSFNNSTGNQNAWYRFRSGWQNQQTNNTGFPRNSKSIKNVAKINPSDKFGLSMMCAYCHCI